MSNVGPPEHEPTVETRAKVVGFACAGFKQTQIADYLDIDEKTLRKHYRYELDKAKMEKTMMLGNNLYADALNGDKVSREFWLKCQGGWHYSKPPEDNDRDSKILSVMERVIDKL
ncbi:MAG: hypothetical protein C5B43_00625 [Verrucomicrobia bacterium]|nr:MAG: hypothetical protein C5B43_00625 [Verrucomicrobiota bacterium]